MSPARLCSALIIVLAAAIPLSGTATASRHAHSAAAPRKQAAFNEHVLNAAIFLDRAGFSPGAIDGRDGENFAKALHAFQQVNGLRVGPLDHQTVARLAEISNTPTLAQYTIQPADVQGPFAPQMPKDFEQMAQLQRLAYHSPRQLLAERFHMSEALLSALNPNARFDQPSTVITVANVAPMPLDPKLAARSGEGSGSSALQESKAAKVVVDKRNHAVLAFAEDNRLLAFLPASIRQRRKAGAQRRIRRTLGRVRSGLHLQPEVRVQGAEGAACCESRARSEQPGRCGVDRPLGRGLRDSRHARARQGRQDAIAWLHSPDQLGRACARPPREERDPDLVCRLNGVRLRQ